MQIKLNTPFVFEQMVCHYASSEFAALQDASETITYDSAQNQTGQQFLGPDRRLIVPFFSYTGVYCSLGSQNNTIFVFR